jgi:Ca2+-binding RTX toxin-like protein
MKRTTLLLAVMVLTLLVASGAALAATIECDLGRCVGTPHPETMYGSDEDLGGYGNWIVGREGADKIYGRGGDDRTFDTGGGLHGQKGDDIVHGGDGQDHIFGGSGADRLFGGRGPDLLDGENQFAGGGLPKDRTGDLFVSGPGDDFLDALDNTEDRVYCGKGHDIVYADAGGRANPYDRPDFVDDSCEDVTRRVS